MASFLGREVMFRAMSTFNHATPGWEALALRAMQNLYTPGSHPRTTSTTSSGNSKQKLTLTTWNMLAYLSHTRAVDRNKFILDQILDGTNPPDIICLQEVYFTVRENILNDERIRSQYFTTDAEDTFRFTYVPMNFSTMTLLSKKRFGSTLDTKKGDEGKLVLDKVFRVKLDTTQEEIVEKKKKSKEPQRRDALCVDIASPSSPGKLFRLMNVHLQSGDAAKRKSQLDLVNNLLRQPQISGGVIAGDFNAHSSDEHSLIEKFNLLDSWVALHGSKNGGTWHGHRLDKVVMLEATPNEIEVLPAGLTKYGFRWSDHCGLRSTFTI